MKIIFLNRYFFPDHSATSQLLGDLAFDLASRNVQTMVITSRQIYDEPAAMLPAREEINGVTVIRVWTSRFGRGGLFGRAVDYLTFYISSFVCILREVSRGDTVVAKTDPPLISVVVCSIVKRKGADLVNWVQDLFPEVAIELGVNLLGGRLGRFLKRIRNYSLKSAKKNVVLGEQMRDRLIGEGIEEESIVIIHNWFDAGVVYPVGRAENPLRKSWGLSNKFVLGYSGNMGRAHEFDTILDAAELLKIEEQVARRELSNVMLKPYQSRTRLAESLSVPDVHFISLRPELEGLIMPSKYYGIAAAGRPAIFSGSLDGEVARILSKTDSGIAIVPGDTQELVNIIKRLSDAREQCEKMGLNARYAFEHIYSMEKSLQAWRGTLGVDNDQAAVQDHGRKRRWP